MIVDQESFCRHWCTNYDEVMKEQTEECESIVACSSSENGMNPDALAAQGLMMKCEEELFEEALENFANIVHHSFTEYNQVKKPVSQVQFGEWWKKEGHKFLEAIKNKNCYES